MSPAKSGDRRSSVPIQGRCYVYVLPCAYEDFAKFGFSRDPLQRMRSLHRRYFEFFDLGRALLVETETVRDARNIELAWRHEFPLHNAPSPLTIRRGAAGHTEWYRGAYESLRERASLLRDSGYTVHDPAKPWIRARALSQSDSLYAWSSAMLEGWRDLRTGLPAEDGPEAALRRTLLDALDAYPALDIPLEPLLPPDVWSWYQDRGSCAF